MDMIRVSRLNGEIFYLNNSLIETIHANPDTVIHLNNDTRYIVKESPDEIISLIIEYNQKIFRPNDLLNDK